MNEEALLLVITQGKNENGFPVETKTEYPVFVREKSVTRSEFYTALQAGVTPKTVFEMRVEDWEQSAHEANGKKAYATRVKYDGYIYEIIRAYVTNKATVELTCS